MFTKIWRVHRIATHTKTKGEDKIKVGEKYFFGQTTKTRVIFMEDHIPKRPDRSVLLGRQSSKWSL